MGYRIIDCHAHLFPDKIAEKVANNLHEYYHLRMDSKGHFSELQNSAKESHIAGLLLLSSATKASQVESINNFVSSTVKRTPGTIGFGSMHFAYPEIKKEMHRIKELGLRGLKLHAEFQNFKIDDEKMFPIYECAIMEDLPILFHLGDETSDYSSPKRMARVLDRYPELRVIGGHLGGVYAWDASIEYLVGRNLYFDTSSVFDILGEEKAYEIMKNHGIEKIVFGTDFPIRLHQSEIEHILNLPLCEAECEMVFHENIERFLSLDEHSFESAEEQAGA